MRPRVFLIALLSTACICGDDAQFLNSKLKHRQRRIYSILVLPAQVAVAKSGFKGSEGLWDKSDQFEDKYTTMVAKVLASYGAKVSQISLGAAPSAEDRSALAEIQRKYDSVDAQIMRNRGGVTKGRYTLSDSVAGYAPASSVDTMVFVRGQGNVPSGKLGSGIRRLLFQGRLAFVDARSGEVLAFLEFMCNSHDWHKSTGELEPHIRNALRAEPVPLHNLLGKSK
jgi:hypothetical protein